LNADPHRMQQVLSNLVQNAIKYSPAGGEIEISLRGEDLGVLVTVSDRGIGLPPEAAESIFEPFGRASNAQRQHMPGMGLGLYIARQIVEQHGGRIWADSSGEGYGTQLHLWLPGIAQQTLASGPEESWSSMTKRRFVTRSATRSKWRVTSVAWPPTVEMHSPCWRTGALT